MKNYLINTLVVLSSVILLTSACKKFVEIDPPKNQITTSTVFSSDATAISALSGIYSAMMVDGGAGGVNSITTMTGRSSDELINHSSNIDVATFFSNSVIPVNAVIRSTLWGLGYKYVFYINSLLEGVENSSNVSAEVKGVIEGEGRFLRAFCYFYLVNMFGDVPLALSSDYRVNMVLSRSSKSSVYNQIIADLERAKSLLGNDYSVSGGKRVRPNKWAASALLARVYLYIGDYAKAETEATSVIGNTSTYSLLPNLNEVFLANSKEAIWQLMPVQPATNSNEATHFILEATPASSSLNTQIVNAFENGDLRKTNWVSSITLGPNIFYYSHKYKVKNSSVVTEYSVILRLAEQYLIRAEARARLNNIAGAKADINIIRERAFGTPTPTAANDQASLLLAIEQERKVEFFTEWGHRWFDLIRTNRATTILGPIKGAAWSPNDMLYPIPQQEILNNPNLTQNPGY